MKLTPEAFDAVSRPKPRPERLIGAPAIARAIGVSERNVHDLARRPDVPIYRPPGFGRYIAFRSELENWLRTKPLA